MRADRVVITPMLGKELNAVSALYHAIWHETHAPLQDPRIAKSRDRAFFESRLQRWQNSTLVALRDTKPVGFASWRGPALEALYIAPQFRSLEIGAKLLVAAENEMRKSGVSELSLDCVCKNIAGRKFYEHNGWRVLKTAELRDSVHQDIATQHWLMVK